MKSTLFSATGLVLIALAAGCSPNAPSSPRNDLVANPAVLELSATEPNGTASFALVCGCPFMLAVDSYFGDTEAISYQIPNMGRNVSRFDVSVSAVQGLPPGNYETKLVARGGTENFRDTLTIRLQVP